MEPTTEQNEIVALANDKANLQIVAYAGTGKTATLRMLAERIDGPKLYLAFNKRIIEEALEDFPAECRTLNSIGHRAWSSAIPTRLVVNDKKTLSTFKEIVKQHSREDASALWDSWDEISEAVALAKAKGYIPRGASNRGRPLAKEEFWSETSLGRPINQWVVDQLLETSIKLAYQGSIDFNDQLYMPTLFGGGFPRFPTVFVDEAQDLNPVNHEMVKKLTRNGRLIYVGDPFQSIYGFRGAVCDGMRRLCGVHGPKTATLSVSFRCKEEIVRNARWRVPQFKWWQSGGRIEQLADLSLAIPADGSCFICRNNAPLFRLALNLLSLGRPCRVAGSDIGPKLVNQLKRLGEGHLSRPAVLSAIESWRERKTASGSRTASDFADCMALFANGARTLDESIAHAEYVLRQDGSIILITGHKAKGLEWDSVFHLDPWLIGNDEQEQNLRYVIQTRARDYYAEIDSKAIQT